MKSRMKASIKGSDEKKGRIKSIRTTDDMELLQLILNDNPEIRVKVIKFIEKSLGKKPSSQQTLKTKKKD
jgi:hypothetical protein